MKYKNLMRTLLSVCLSTTALSLDAVDDVPVQASNNSDVTPVTSLEDALARTYEQNTDLDAQRAGLRATDEGVSQALSGWRPSVSVQGKQTKQWDFPSQGRDQHGATTGVTTTVQQNIYAGGGTVAQTKQAESNVFAGRANLFGQEQQSLFAAVQAFFEVIAKREIVEARKNNEAFLKRTLAHTQARYEVGEVSRTDVAASEASYAQATAERVSAEGDLENANATFLRVVGSPAGNLAMPKVLLPLPEGVQAAKEVALAKNPAIAAAQHTLEAAQHNVDVQMSGLLPSVDLQGSNARTHQSGSFQNQSRNTDLSIVATATMPLYDRGLPNSKVRQAYQTVGQNKVQLEGARRSVVEAVTQAWDSLISNQKAVEQWVASVKAQKLAVEGVTEEANVGLKTVLDILQQEQDAINAQVSLIQSEQALMVASYQLLASMGQLTARDLALNVKYYNPEHHYDDVKWANFQFWEGEDERYVKDGDEVQ